MIWITLAVYNFKIHHLPANLFPTCLPGLVTQLTIHFAKIPKTSGSSYAEEWCPEVLSLALFEIYTVHATSFVFSVTWKVVLWLLFMFRIFTVVYLLRVCSSKSWESNLTACSWSPLSRWPIPAKTYCKLAMQQMVISWIAFASYKSFWKFRSDFLLFAALCSWPSRK